MKSIFDGNENTLNWKFVVVYKRHIKPPMLTITPPHDYSGLKSTLVSARQFSESIFVLQ